ncbi:MAG: ATP synthase subunit I [Acidobacteriia bacterium]|nr:ATP synthase subunit I [Terriglobia bacterium]
MTTTDELTVARAARRIERFMAGIAAFGAVAAFVFRGWQWAAGFLFGALLSGLNFHWLKRLVESLGGEGRRARGSVFLAFRYLLLGGAAYVILKRSSVSLPAVLAGLFVATAAVFIEVIFEIAYARK